MADATDKRAMLKQCLTDIGYEDAEISVLMNGGIEPLLQSLTERRKRLLSGIHHNQKCLDCLDFLVYQIRREKPDP